MGAGDADDSSAAGRALLSRDLRAGTDTEFGETANDQVVAWCAYNVGDDDASAGLEFTQFSAIP